MKYYIYKITNTQNNMIYIGYHKSETVNDNYMGSGTKIKEAIREYGKESFVKQILFEFNDRKSALEKEKELVTLDFIKLETNYNMVPGGHGGFDYINANKLGSRIGKKHTGITKEKCRVGSSGRIHSEDTKKKISTNNGMYKVEAKKKISDNLKSRLLDPKEKDRILSIGKQTRLTKERALELLNLKIECPHCKKEGHPRHIKRYHFDKCRYKSLP